MSGGQVPKLTPNVVIIDRPGADGVVSRVVAKKAEEATIYTLQGLQYENDAKAAIDTYAALKGTAVTVIDDLGRSVTDVLVVDVRVTETPQKVLTSQPANINYLVKSAWVLKATA